MNTKNIFGIVGLGLIGGSIAKALRVAYPESIIYVYNRSEEPRKLALEDGTATKAFDNISSDFVQCDYIFLCTPVEYNVDYLKQLHSIIDGHTIITDVGSTKTNIHEAVIALSLEANFIGGHPMAGSEKTGYRHASVQLLENAFYAITPTALSPQEKIDELKEIVTKMGAIAIQLDYKEHDYSVAAISHLPHVIASSLVNLVRESDSKSETMKTLAAGGFRDITRIASSSPVMWEQICSANADNIVKLLNRYIENLQAISEQITNNNKQSIHDMFEHSKNYRDTFDNKQHVKGPISSQYRIHCDVRDEPGAIAVISSLLAFNQISIKNIGISNNREFEPGVLRIEFYDKESLEKATVILRDHNYPIYLFE